MKLERYHHTSVVQENGNVLIMGGLSRSFKEVKKHDPTGGIYYELELIAPENTGIDVYDPTSKKFNYTAEDMPPLYHPLSLLLNDGRVLILDSSIKGGLLAYTPRNNKFDYINYWQGMNSLHSLHSPITGEVIKSEEFKEPPKYDTNPTMTLLKNGNVLFTGGELRLHTKSDIDTHSTNLAFIYDSKTNEVKPAGELECFRKEHQATLLRDGRVLITGGVAEGGCNNDKKWFLSRTLLNAEIYDPEKDQFTAVGNMNIRRRAHTATLLRDGQVLITGGVTDNKSLSYTTKDGHPLMISRGGSLTIADAELYNPEKQSFTLIDKMYSQRAHHTATLLSNGNVLIIGGCKDYTCTEGTSSAEIYNSKEKMFERIGHMKERRHHHSANLLKDGTVLITGGGSRCRRRLRTAELFHPSK